MRRWEGWWGDDPPYHVPVFVLTHHEREPVEIDGDHLHFVTDGIESALDQAREAAGGKDVVVAGGAKAIQQYLAAGHLDELELQRRASATRRRRAPAGGRRRAEA